MIKIYFFFELFKKKHIFSTQDMDSNHVEVCVILRPLLRWETG